MNPADAMRYLVDRGHFVPGFDEVAPFPIPALISEEMPADESLALWEAARLHAPGTGYAPVLVGAEPMAEWFAGKRWSSFLKRISTSRKRYAADPAAVRASLEARLADRFSPQVIERLREEMETVRPAWLVRSGGEPAQPLEMEPSRFVAGGEPVRCLLLRCPPAEVPIYLGLGGWNGSPDPHEQAQLLAGWHARHGTSIVHVGRGSVAMFSERPPVRIDELRPLLWETFLYCYDAVFQDADGTFASLRRMLSSPWWCFSWD